MATNYTLTAIIDTAQVAKLKAAGLGLFFGKVVEDASGNPTVNVIWKSNPEFVHENKFEWQATYAIAGAVINTAGAKATAATVVQPVSLGQSVTVDAAGNLGIANGAVGTGPITFYNNDPKLDFSALLYCTGCGGTTTQTPIYVSGPVQAGFKVKLTPIETVAVWFAANEATSTIIANASNDAYQVEYLSATAHTISWLKQDSGKWEWQKTV